VSDVVTLREITAENESVVRALAVSQDQELFVDSVSESLEEAAASPDAHPWYRAIYAGDRAVGFVMLSYDVPPGHPDYPWRYYLWRLLVDARYQRRGFGRAAMALAIDHVRRGPGATDLFTSVRPGEGSPRPFYRALGFASTGVWAEGEEIFRLRLRPER
jgi:diamine N-acetyltransferase